jgi:hypothetical protein
MSKIETLYEMRRAGYKFLNHAKCKSCHADIEWWETCNGRKMPFNPMPEDQDAPTTAHFVTCPDADKHRKSKEQKPLPGDKLPYPRRLELIREFSDARAIVAIWADGTGTSTVRQGLDPEELRHDLITLTNKMRNHLLESQPGTTKGRP